MGNLNAFMTSRWLPSRFITETPCSPYCSSQISYINIKLYSINPVLLIFYWCFTSVLKLQSDVKKLKFKINFKWFCNQTLKISLRSIVQKRLQE